jgi:biotin carboxyl carrier protein
MTNAIGDRLRIYYVTIGKNEYQIEINGNEIKINGESVNATLIALKEYGVHLLRKGFAKREIHIKEQGRSKYVIDSIGSHAIVNVGKTRTSQHQSTAHKERDIFAPLPGQVVSVHVKVGDQVKKGQIMIIMESMKMQMILQASRNGTVAQVEAEVGKSIAKDDVLVVFEED